MLPPPGLDAATITLVDTIPTLLSSAVFAIATIDPTGVLIPNLPSTTEAIGGAFSTAGATAAGSKHGPQDAPPNGECRLLGPFALIVQAALGGLALLALVYKRYRERPQRPVKIWAFDVSKQVVGSVLVHIANLLMSMLSSGQFSIKVGPEHIQRRDGVTADGRYVPNPCSFYLLNLAIDTTIGIPILILLLRIFTALFTMTPFGNPPESIRSGNYGQPPRTYWWFKQSIIYFLGLMGMKFCVLVIFLVLPWISRIGDWALRWTEGNERLQVFFVMLFFPVVMNATQYYIIDSFIKNQKPSEHEPLPSDDRDSDDGTDDGGPFVDPLSGANEEVDPELEDEIAKKEAVDIKASTRPLGKGIQGTSGAKDRHNYNPQFDGDGSPTVIGSGSNSEREQLLSRGSESDDERKSHRR